MINVPYIWIKKGVVRYGVWELYMQRRNLRM